MSNIYGRRVKDRHPEAKMDIGIRMPWNRVYYRVVVPRRFFGFSFPRVISDNQYNSLDAWASAAAIIVNSDKKHLSSTQQKAVM